MKRPRRIGGEETPGFLYTEEEAPSSDRRRAPLLLQQQKRAEPRPPTHRTADLLALDKPMSIPAKHCPGFHPALGTTILILSFGPIRDCLRWKTSKTEASLTSISKWTGQSHGGS